MPIEHHLAVERSARYFTLGADSRSAREVWFLLHGHGQLAAQFIQYFRDLDDGTRLLVAPEALNRYYLVRPQDAPAAERPVGATWMTREDREREIADYVAYLEQLYATVLGASAEHAHIVVLGFSQGAATAARWVARGSSRIDALVLWGGLLPPELDRATASWIGGAELTLVAGNADQYVTPMLLSAEEQALRDHGSAVRVQRFDGGHVIRRTSLGELARAVSASADSGRRSR